MNITYLKAAELLEAVGTLFLIPEWHTKGALAEDCNGEGVVTTSPAACSFCALGGLDVAEKELRTQAFNTAEIALTADFAVRRSGDIVDFNDTTERTSQQVAEAFFRTAARLRKQAAKS